MVDLDEDQGRPYQKYILTVPAIAAEDYVVDPVVVVLHGLYVLFIGLGACVPYPDDGVSSGRIQFPVIRIQLQCIDAIPVLLLLGVPYHKGNLPQTVVADV